LPTAVVGAIQFLPVAGIQFLPMAEIQFFLTVNPCSLLAVRKILEVTSTPWLVTLFIVEASNDRLSHSGALTFTFSSGASLCFN
jgi:hypothetical protein